MITLIGSVYQRSYYNLSNVALSEVILWLLDCVWWTAADWLNSFFAVMEIVYESHMLPCPCLYIIASAHYLHKMNN